MPEMDDVTHADHGNRIDVLGYRTCDNEHCGTLILEQIAARTGGFCLDCFSGRLGDTFAGVEVQIRSQRMKIPPTRKPRTSTGKGNRWTHKQGEKARTRARRRLCLMFPELYELLLAEERARAGLEPFPADRLTESAGDASGTLAFASLYHALQDHGVDVDGLEIPDARAPDDE